MEGPVLKYHMLHFRFYLTRWERRDREKSERQEEPELVPPMPWEENVSCPEAFSYRRAIRARKKLYHATTARQKLIIFSRFTASEIIYALTGEAPKRHKSRERYRERNNLIVKMRMEGMTMREIARRMNITEKIVEHVLCKRGCVLPHNKISQSLHDKIVALYSKYKNYLLVARELSLPVSTVYYHVKKAKSQ